MRYQNMTLEELKSDLIKDAHKGYPLFIAGALYWAVMCILGLFIEGKMLALCYLLGIGGIFPLGVLISRMLNINLFSKNPLSALGGIVGGIQAFFMPLWIVIYIEFYALLPMAIGLLAASHFLPYAWIYKSKTYLLFTIVMAIVSFIFGYIFNEMAFTVLPILLSIIYVVNVGGLIAETRKHKPGKVA